MTRASRAYEETLSLRDLARLAPDPEPSAGPPAQAAAMRPRVFVIDDEEGICKFVATAVAASFAAPSIAAMSTRTAALCR
jgi:hypothetical protein